MGKAATAKKPQAQPLPASTSAKKLSDEEFHEKMKRVLSLQHKCKKVKPAYGELERLAQELQGDPRLGDDYGLEVEDLLAKGGGTSMGKFVVVGRYKWKALSDAAMKKLAAKKAAAAAG